MRDVLSYLERTDKWYLGGGQALIWAPPFPLFLNDPGFWDEAHYYDHELKPGFTWSVLHQGREIALKPAGYSWQPHRIKQLFCGQGVTVVEEKAVVNNCLCSRVTLTSDTAVDVDLVLWRVAEHNQQEGREVRQVDVYGSTILCEQASRHSYRGALPIVLLLGADRQCTSFSVASSQPASTHPRFSFTPFAEQMCSEQLNNCIAGTGIGAKTLYYQGLHYSLRLKPGTPEAITFALAANHTRDKAAEQIAEVLARDPIELSRNNWQHFFAQVPQFACSNPYYEKYYWYRWYGLYLNALPGGELNFTYPGVCEGIAYFRALITYSAQCHMRECRWLANPDLAQGSLLNFIEHQFENGSFSGHIYSLTKQRNGFYHANWGDSTLDLLAVHPNDRFARAAYNGLARYAEYFFAERDQEDSNLFDVVDQYETGQEYMSRYLFVDEQADVYGWENGIRLKGVDATIYLYTLCRALGTLAKMLAKPTAEVKRWQSKAEEIRQAVLRCMWDAKRQMFKDVHPVSGAKSYAEAAVCFYPYFTDIVSDQHLNGLKQHLLNPDEFWTQWPVPSSSKADPYFDSEARWKGKRHNCPWNGRTWPMTNSHIAEALIKAAELDPALQSKAVEFIDRFIRLMFADQDINRPNCYEHYNPENGMACYYRGIDDYQHSWVVDLIIKYVVGVRPQLDERLVIDPLPFGCEHFNLRNVGYKGHRLDVEWQEGVLTVWVDDKLAARSQGLCRHEIQL